MFYKIRYYWDQFWFLVPQLFESFAEFPHGLIVVLTTFGAMIWSGRAVWTGTFVSENWAIFIFAVVGFTIAILFHLRVKNDHGMRMHVAFRLYPKAFFSTLGLWILSLTVAMWVVAIATGFLSIIIILLGASDGFTTFLSIFAVTGWLALGISLLFWGVLAADASDHAEEDYGLRGQRSQDW